MFVASNVVKGKINGRDIEVEIGGSYSIKTQFAFYVGTISDNTTGSFKILWSEGEEFREEWIPFTDIEDMIEF